MKVIHHFVVYAVVQALTFGAFGNKNQFAL